MSFQDYKLLFSPKDQRLMAGSGLRISSRRWSSKEQKTSRTGFSKVSNNFSYADALRGRVGKPNSTILKGWRCRDCGSRDVFATVIGEHSGSVQVTPQQGAGNLKFGR